MNAHIVGKTSHGKEMSAHSGEKQFGCWEKQITCREKQIDIGGKQYDVEEITNPGEEKYFNVEGITNSSCGKRFC